MKKMIITALVAVFVTTSSFAAEVSVNSKITDGFRSEFAGASDATWAVGNDFAKVAFTLNGEKMEAFYNFDGSLIGTSKSIALNKLPKAAIKTITQKYPFPPYALKDCIEFTNADGEKKCYVSLEEEGKTKLILEVLEAGSVNIFKKEKVK